jgi:DNA-binding winged helix-turn-helix (wHTH) protein/dipeptidyl aminopeptidase/acylaminoacyl peptidase
VPSGPLIVLMNPAVLLMNPSCFSDEAKNVAYRFEEFEFDDANFRLSRTGEAVSLEPKALRLLLYLLENSNRLVRKQELLDCVWPEANVGENALTRAVVLLRKGLGEDTRVPRFIETVPTLGYRFIAHVTVTDVSKPASAAADPAPVEETAGPISTRPPKPGWSRGSRLAIVSGILAVIAAGLFGVAAWVAPAKVSGPLDSTQITSSPDPKQGLLFTDGLRLYFYSRGEPVEMAVGGGIIAPAHIFGPAFHLVDISADGSKALARAFVPNDETGRGTLWTQSTLGGTPHKLSDHLALTARWSPDGRSVVFADQHSIYRIDEDGRNLTKIWDAPGTVVRVSFSPDARLLSASVGSALGGANPQLWQLETGGGNAHPMQFGWPANVNESSGQWTPDGSHFVFFSDREGLNNVYELVTPRWFEFWKKPAAVRITGNQLTILGAAPARDSKSLFVLGRPDQGAMQVLDLATGKFVPYLDGLNAVNFVISPDRQWMAYVEYRNHALWKSRLDGSERSKLATSGAYMPQWSPDGKSLVYSDLHHLYLISADGGEPETLVSDGDSKDGTLPGMPSWSHDGRSISWSYYPFPNQPLTGIHVLDLASRHRSVMSGSEGYYVPSWSPDGRYLVAIAQKPLRMVLYSAATKTWKDLKQFDTYWGLWIWSNDSRSIYMAMIHAQPGIYRLSVPDGEWKRISGLEGLVDLAGRDAFPSLTPDGRPALMGSTGVAQVYSLRWKP